MCNYSAYMFVKSFYVLLYSANKGVSYWHLWSFVCVVFMNLLFLFQNVKYAYAIEECFLFCVDAVYEYVLC